MSHKSNTIKLTPAPLLSRILPFIAYMAFVAIEEGLRYLLNHQILSFDPSLLTWIYLPKVFLVGLILIMFRQNFTELRITDLKDSRALLVSISSGILVFFLWIHMDWTLGSNNSPAGFNPENFHSDIVQWGMIAIRITGAVVVVPIMEELFWRSFLLRYLIDNNFMDVKIGHFSALSFIGVTILFGLEHHYLFAGMMAGAIFNGICYYTKSITHCVISHAIANLCLAIYVLKYSQWQFW